MKTIAIMNHPGVIFKETALQELSKRLGAMDFRILYPEDADDLLGLIIT